MSEIAKLKYSKISGVQILRIRGYREVGVKHSKVSIYIQPLSRHTFNTCISIVRQDILHCCWFLFSATVKKSNDRFSFVFPLEFFEEVVQLFEIDIGTKRTSPRSLRAPSGQRIEIGRAA